MSDSWRVGAFPRAKVPAADDVGVSDHRPQKNGDWRSAQAAIVNAQTLAVIDVDVMTTNESEESQTGVRQKANTFIKSTGDYPSNTTALPYSKKSPSIRDKFASFGNLLIDVVTSGRSDDVSDAVANKTK